MQWEILPTQSDQIIRREIALGWFSIKSLVRNVGMTDERTSIDVSYCGCACVGGGGGGGGGEWVCKSNSRPHSNKQLI